VFGTPKAFFGQSPVLRRSGGATLGWRDDDEPTLKGLCPVELYGELGRLQRHETTDG